MNHNQPQPASDVQPRGELIAWFVAVMGYGDDLLYWGDILAAYLRYFPRSRFFDGAASDRRIPGTDRTVEGLNWRHLNLGSRKGTYDRKLMVVSPFSLARLRKLRPQLIVISEFALASILVTTFRRWLGSRILLLVESDPVRGRPQRLSNLKRAIRKYVVRRVDLILTNNAGGQQHLIRDLGVPSSKICVQPFLVSDPRSDSDLLPESLPAELAADLEHIVFLFVGQLVARKGVNQMIDAIARMEPTARAKCRFWLVGDGEQKEQIEAKLKALELDAIVRVLGKRPYSQLPSFYQAADVFVLPTLDDYRALVGFEAIRYGLPMLHSIHDGAISEVVDEGRNGFGFDPLDAPAFAKTLELLASTQVDLEAFGARSLEISRPYTLDQGASNLAAAVAKCIDDVGD